MSNAWDEAQLGHNYVNVEHLFLSIFRDPTNIAAKVLQEMGLKKLKISESSILALGKRVDSSKQTSSMVPTPTCGLFGEDLAALAKEGKLDPVIGREKSLKESFKYYQEEPKTTLC